MKGSCLCGDVTYTVEGEISGFSVCHCGQCRKQSGHLWSSAHVADDGIEITGDVRWYQSSPEAKRGFCPTCGAFLFWKLASDPHISFSLGSVDGPTGARLKKHIFTADKGDYYDISDGLPQF